MASKPKLLTRTRELHVDMTLAGHESVYRSRPDGRRSEDKSGPVICYFPDGQQMISGSTDKTTRLWDLRTGKESKEARVVNEREVHAVAVSRDGRWIITAGAGGELKAHEVKTGIVKIFECHPGGAMCIDISVDSKLLASGSWDGSTARIWSLDTGKLVAGPFKCAQPNLLAVRFSRNSKKFAVYSCRSDTGRSVEVWDIEAQKMNVNVRSPMVQEDRNAGFGIGITPVFWTMQDRTIVGVFSHPYAINELDASTLGTIGTPFKGHTELITRFELSFDCAFLVSASIDGTIKFWAFDSRQLIASFNFHSLLSTFILSPDARKIALTVREDGPHKIYICDIPPNILADVSRPHKEVISASPRSNALDSDATTRPAAVRHNQVMVSSVTQPSRHSPTIPQRQLSVLRHLRKLLPSSLYAGAVSIAHTVEPRDPLDYPATSSRLPSHLLTHLQSSPPLEPPVSLSPPSTTIENRPSQISNWWPIRTGDALPPIVDVPLAPGQLRHAAAGAPTSDDGYVLDEDVDSHDESHPPAGEHGRVRLCGCF